MPKCCDCEQDLPKTAFAKVQLKKNQDARRCKECAAKIAILPADKKEEKPIVEATVKVVKKPSNDEKNDNKKNGDKKQGDIVAWRKDLKSASKSSKKPKQQSSNEANSDQTEKRPAKDQKNDTKKEKAEEATDIPPGLVASLSLFTLAQQDLAKSLCGPLAKQSHIFAHWEASASADGVVKQQLMEQLETMDRSYPSGGLVGYLANARELLDKSRRGVNPLEGWKPSVPTGDMFELGTEEFEKVEELGLKEVGSCGFVLVAGGLGERLGYGGIKIGLPTELATETCYLEFYIEIILSLQSKYALPGIELPLCIMTSGDTNAKTVELLERNNYFGMDKAAVTIVQQGEGVPALENNDAKIALDASNPYKVLSKPHGHGDIHSLLHSEGVVKKWLASGIRWTVFFQDTNGLAFHTLPLALGVSKKLGLLMNSMAAPRKAKQAIGGITKLENEEGGVRTINVEYNQLDPLLRASGFPNGDVDDEKTGFSPFPGNINQLLFSLEPYAKVLEKTNGAMPEFVNPKYKDSNKRVFKKPTRLECMMQDFPTVLKGSEAEKVGFTSIAAEVCFSPVKNATSDGLALQQKGTHPGVAASGEADQYGAVRKILQSIGCNVIDAEPETFKGITIIPGPAIVLKPSFVLCPHEYKAKFPNPSQVKISPRSTLVVSGTGVVIESLDLDGTLHIECEDGASGIIKDLVVVNKGWEKVVNDSSTDEIINMRGYHLNKIETESIFFKKDGSIRGDYAHPSDRAEDIKAPNDMEKSSKVVAISAPSLTEPAQKQVEEKKTECNCIIL